VTYRDAIGAQRFESCKTSNKKEAEQRLIDRRKEAQEGLSPAAPIKPLALEDLQARYLIFVGHQRGVATKQYHFAHFKRVWGNPPIHALTVEVLDQYRAFRLGEKVGPATINREMATLKHALSKAVEWRLLRKTAREELTAIKKYQEPDGRLRYLAGEAEAERLLQACDASLSPIVLTALHTGMRKGELLGLTWDLSPTMTLRYAHLSPKHLTSAVRVLDPHSASSLDSYLTIQPKQTPEEVFVDVGNESDETQKCLARNGEYELVPKAGFEPAHPCGR
jgi:integrase